MPTIDVAMARSLRGGAWGSIRNALARSITANLARRGFVDDAQGKANDVATAFSSWDNCMNAAYCKWPVIGIMVIGGLIIFSIIWCIIRCCCCGVSCCCGCCQCLKCCGDCCGACDPPGTRNKHKHLDDPYPPQPNHGYRSEAPMNASASPFAPRVDHNDFNNNAGHHTGVTQPSVPQYAEFETSKRGGGEDSLPEMPSWENAATKKVMVHEEEVEMKNLRKSPAPEQQMGAMNNTPSNRSSPAPQGRNPYGPPPGRQSPYLGVTQQPDPYSPIDQNFGYRSNTPVNAYGMHQPYANNSPSSPRDVTGNGYGANHSYANNSPSSPRDVTGNGYGANPSYANNSHSSAELPATGYGVDQSYANKSSYTAGDATVNGYGTNQTYGNNTIGGTGSATMGSERDAPVELQGSDSFGPVTTNTYGQSNINPGQTTYAEAPGDPVYPQSRTPFNDNSNHDGYRRATPGPVYGTDPNMRQSPAPHQDPYGYGQSPRRTPGPPNDYAYNQARRTPGPGGDIDRFFSPAPDRQYGAASPRPLDRPVPHRIYDNEHSQSPITNNSGFDFNSAHTRPEQSPTTTSPYPGYKAYQPA